MKWLVVFVIFPLATSSNDKQTISRRWAELWNASPRQYRLDYRSYEDKSNDRGCFLRNFHLRNNVSNVYTYSFTKCWKAEGTYPQSETLVADIYPPRNTSEKAVIDVRKEGEPAFVSFSVKHWDEPGECFLLTFFDENGNLQCEVYVWERNPPDERKRRECEEKYRDLCSVKNEVQPCEC